MGTLTVRSPKPKITVASTPGCVSAEELKQIGEWIETLAEGDTGIARDRAFGLSQNNCRQDYDGWS